MATVKKKRNKDSGSNDSVIASRILQDIINNSSESFRTFLQQQGIGGDVQPQVPAPAPYTPAVPQPPVGMPPMAPQPQQGFGGLPQDPQALQLMQLLGLA